jgi:hypothetical protein
MSETETITLTGRQLHYLLQLVAADSGRRVYLNDDESKRVIEETHTVLTLAIRAWFNELEPPK